MRSMFAELISVTNPLSYPYIIPSVCLSLSSQPASCSAHTFIQYILPAYILSRSVLVSEEYSGNED